MSVAIAQALCEFIQEEIVGDDVDISIDSPLADFGVDSFSLVSILLFVEREYEVNVPLESLTPEHTATPLAFAARIQMALDE